MEGPKAAAGPRGSRLKFPWRGGDIGSALGRFVAGTRVVFEPRCDVNNKPSRCKVPQTRRVCGYSKYLGTKQRGEQLKCKTTKGPYGRALLCRGLKTELKTTNVAIRTEEKNTRKQSF